jgi:hypothetical protein
VVLVEELLEVLPEALLLLVETPPKELLLSDDEYGWGSDGEKSDPPLPPVRSGATCSGT